MKEKFVYKIPPYTIWQVKEYENWLSNLAEEGLELQKVGSIWVKFKQTMPQKLEYRIYLSDEKLSKEVQERYEWRQLKKSKVFSIYVSSKADVHTSLYVNKEKEIEILTDHEDRCKRLIFWYAILAAFIIYIIGWEIAQGQFVLNLVQDGIPFIWIILLTQSITIYEQGRQYYQIHRLKEELEKGYRAQKEVSSRTGARILRGVYIGGVLISLIFIAIGFMTIEGEWHTLPLEELKIPVIQLSNLEQDSTLRRDPDHAEYRFDNYYEKNWNLFAIRTYEAEEDAILDAKEGYDKHPRIETEFYQLTFRSMREALINDLIERYQSRIVHPYKEIIREDAEGLDGVYILDKPYDLELIAVKDNRVMYVSYRGNATLEALIKEVARKITY